MSKKNKKNRFYRDDNTYGKAKKAKKNKKSVYDEPALKMVKPNLSKKDAKISKKILLQPVDIPKQFKKNRERCNHAGGIMSVYDFMNMTPNYAAFTPMLNSICTIYGKDHVHICKNCYDALVDIDNINVNNVQQAIVTLYVAANAALANRRMKGDEIEAITKARDELINRWGFVIETIRKINDMKSEYASYAKTAQTNSGSIITAEELNKLNSVTNNANVY